MKQQAIPKYTLKAKIGLTLEDVAIDKETKEAGLHVKHTHQIEKMLESHSNKLPKIQKKLQDRLDYPQYYEKRMRDNDPDIKTDEINQRLLEDLQFYQEKVSRLADIVHLLGEEKRLRSEEKATRDVYGTTFYIDADNGDNNNSGLNPTASASTNISATTASNDRVTTSSAHGLTTGDEVTIAGNTGTTPDINGANQAITVVDTTNFTIDGVDITVDGNADGTVQEEDGPFADLHAFTETGRSAADIVKIRRGTTARIDDGGDLNFTSDGDYDMPIVAEADYDDDWSDFANSAQTYTMVHGSKTHTASATISGVSVGDWVFNTTDSDDPRQFAYEVAAVSGTTLTLFLPFKGATGATKTLKVMPAAPVWGQTTAAFGWNISSDLNWKFLGIDNRSSDSLGNVLFTNAQGHFFLDCIFTNAGLSNDFAFSIPSSGRTGFKLSKCRTFDCQVPFDFDNSQVVAKLFAKDCLFDCNSISGATVVNVSTSGSSQIEIEESEFANCTTGVSTASTESYSEIKLRNIVLTNVTNFIDGTGADSNSSPFTQNVFVEDYNNTVGDNRFTNGPLVLGAVDTFLFQSETTKVRSGGSNKSIKVIPVTDLSVDGALSQLKLLDIPIFAAASEKTYTVFFASDNIAEFTANPTAAELWIELEYWGHASNNFRRITKSTGTVDFTTDTDFDQSLAITVAPSQAGVAYLRVWYGKPKEAADTNIFYVDPIPVIS